MENKYYTPEIEEFYVGFEYEMVIPVGFTYIDFSNPDEKPEITWSDKYSKGVFQVKPADPFGGELASIAAAIKINKCRVKYLDKEDIESLGWVGQKANSVYFKKGKYRLVHWMDKPVRLVTIIEEYTGGEEIILRKAMVKNKSELKKLLKQLGII